MVNRTTGNLRPMDDKLTKRILVPNRHAAEPCLPNSFGRRLAVVALGFGFLHFAWRMCQLTRLRSAHSLATSSY